MNIKTLCLGALSLGEMSGYDIKRLFADAFNHFHSASYGSIYPALARLEGEGLVTCRRGPAARHPDRKTFRITQSGRDTLVKELMGAAPTEHVRSEFLVLMFFAHLLTTERLAAVLQDVRARYQDKLAYLKSVAVLPGHTPGTSFAVQAGIARHRAMLELLDTCGPDLLREHAAQAAVMTDTAHA
jgi:DNA-binding PadR family transcriptional regulator